MFKIIANNNQIYFKQYSKFLLSLNVCHVVHSPTVFEENSHFSSGHGGTPCKQCYNYGRKAQKLNLQLYKMSSQNRTNN